jgi:uncharacterized lipoprotein YajG
MVAPAVMTGGCAFISEDIQLQPTIAVAASEVGHGTPVAVQVVDERPSAMLGQRGPMRSAEIRTTQNVDQVVETAVRDGLSRQGFAPVALGAEAPVSLKVEVRDLRYETGTGFWTGGIFTRAALKAVASRGSETFEQMYRAENEERVVFVPTEAADTESINKVLSEAIAKMLADQRLLSFLSTPPPTAATSAPAPQALPASLERPPSQ